MKYAKYDKPKVKTKVLVVFPVCFKEETFEEIYDEYPNGVMDVDSLNFHWWLAGREPEENEEKKVQLNFDEIQWIHDVVENMSIFDVIILSYHKIVREKLSSFGIQYNLIYPKLPHKAKWIGKMNSLNIDGELIDDVDSIWDDTIEFDLMKDNCQKNIPIDDFITKDIIKICKSNPIKDWRSMLK